MPQTIQIEALRAIGWRDEDATGSPQAPSDTARLARVVAQHRTGYEVHDGTTLLEDRSVLELVVERGVTIEACPTSNVHTGIIGNVNEHPLPRWLELGVRACVCADNTLLSDVSTASEYERASRIPGRTAERVALAIAHGHAASFPKR